MKRWLILFFSFSVAVLSAEPFKIAQAGDNDQVELLTEEHPNPAELIRRTAGFREAVVHWRAQWAQCLKFRRQVPSWKTNFTVPAALRRRSILTLRKNAAAVASGTFIRFETPREMLFPGCCRSFIAKEKKK